MAVAGLSGIIPGFMSFEDGDDITQWQQLKVALAVFSDLWENSICQLKGEFVLWRSK